MAKNQKRPVARSREMFAPWTPKQEQALALALEGRWSGAEIAAKCGISPRTYEVWKAHTAWKSRLEAERADLAASLRDVVYADKRQRIVALAQMAESARREYEARPWLLETRPTPNGEITNETFNRDAHEAFRKALDDIAKELGERTANLNIQATVAQFGVNVVLERMRDDPSVRGDVQRLIAGVASATR